MLLGSCSDTTCAAEHERPAHGDPMQGSRPRPASLHPVFTVHKDPAVAVYRSTRAARSAAGTGMLDGLALMVTVEEPEGDTEADRVGVADWVLDTVTLEVPVDDSVRVAVGVDDAEPVLVALVDRVVVTVGDAVTVAVALGEAEVVTVTLADDDTLRVLLVDPVEEAEAEREAVEEAEDVREEDCVADGDAVFETVTDDVPLADTVTEAVVEGVGVLDGLGGVQTMTRTTLVVIEEDTASDQESPFMSTATTSHAPSEVPKYAFWVTNTVGLERLYHLTPSLYAKKKSVVPSLFTSAGAKRSARLEKGVKVLLTRENPGSCTTLYKLAEPEAMMSLSPSFSRSTIATY